jgi:hypothetical protein
MKARPSKTWASVTRAEIRAGQLHMTGYEVEAIHSYLLKGE